LQGNSPWEAKGPVRKRRVHGDSVGEVATPRATVGERSNII